MANSRLLSRWYPGAGLYRNVHLIVNEDVHIPMWGTQLSTPVVKNDFARVRLNTSLVMPEGKSSSSYRIVTEIKNAVGSVVCKGEKQLTDFDGQTFSQEFVVEKLELWTPDAPYLYTAESKVYEGNVVKDESVTPFGIRSIEIIPNKGFFLNGKKTVFKGVCNHHDLGPLGAAVNDAAIRRQIHHITTLGLLR